MSSSLDMLRRKEVFTTITPIPSTIPRQLAIDLLHNHSELITVNPLVVSHKAIKAPNTAASDEYYSTWYEIIEKVKLMPGIGKFGVKTISFNACFHDMPWGVQSHVYAPAGVDMRNNWRICGNEPGEPPERHEMGIDAPRDGLYLREDIEIKCNVTMINFVKAEMKKASKVMVERMVKKAQLLDAGVLQGMFEDGKLKTFNPNDRSDANRLRPQSMWSNDPQSPGGANQGMLSPHQSFRAPKSPPQSYNRPVSMMSNYPYSQSQPTVAGAMELPAHPYHQQQQQPQQQQQDHKTQPATIMELPGDYYHPEPQRTSPRIPHSPSDYGNNTGGVSPNTESQRWSEYSAGSRPDSYASNTDSGYGSQAPYRQSSMNQQQRHGSSDLATHKETSEEHRRSSSGPYSYQPHPAVSPLMGRDPAQLDADRAAALKQLEAMNINSNPQYGDPNLRNHPAVTGAYNNELAALPSQQVAAQKYDGHNQVPLPLMPRVPNQGGGKPRVVLP